MLHLLSTQDKHKLFSTVASYSAIGAMVGAFIGLIAAVLYTLIYRAFHPEEPRRIMPKEDILKNSIIASTVLGFFLTGIFYFCAEMKKIQKDLWRQRRPTHRAYPVDGAPEGMPTMGSVLLPRDLPPLPVEGTVVEMEHPLLQVVRIESSRRHP